MNKLFIILAFLIILSIGCYYVPDSEKNDLNKAERASLGGTYINLSDGITHFKLEGQENGRLVVLIHGGTVPLWTWDKSG